MRSPVSRYSLARSMPISSGHVAAPPSPAVRPDVHVGVGDVRALGDEHDVAAHGDAGAETDRGAVHRGDDGEVEAQHLVDEPLRVAQRLAPVLGVVVVADEARACCRRRRTPSRRR